MLASELGGIVLTRKGSTERWPPLDDGRAFDDLPHTIDMS